MKETSSKSRLNYWNSGTARRRSCRARTSSYKNSNRKTELTCSLTYRDQTKRSPSPRHKHRRKFRKICSKKRNPSSLEVHLMRLKLSHRSRRRWPHSSTRSKRSNEISTRCTRTNIRSNLGRSRSRRRVGQNKNSLNCLPLFSQSHRPKARSMRIHPCHPSSTTPNRSSSRNRTWKESKVWSSSGNKLASQTAALSPSQIQPFLARTITLQIRILASNKAVSRQELKKRPLNDSMKPTRQKSSGPS